MSTEFTPLNPSNRPNPLTGDGVIGRYEQQDKRGQSDGGAQPNTPTEPTTENPASPPPPNTGSLTSDTFWRNRRTTTPDQLFNESLPWENTPEPPPPPPAPPKGPTGPLAPLRSGPNHLSGPGRDAYSTNRAVHKTWAAHQASIQQLKPNTPANPSLGTAPKTTAPSPFAGLPAFAPPESPTSPLPPLHSPQTTPVTTPGRETPQHPTTPYHPSQAPTPDAPSTTKNGEIRKMPSATDDTQRKATTNAPEPASTSSDHGSPQTSNTPTRQAPNGPVKPKNPSPMTEPKLNRAGVVCRVTDNQQVPVMGANLEWVPTNDMLPVINATTDSEGYYRSPDFAPGDYTLFTRSKGFVPHEQIVQLIANQSNTVTVIIQKP